MRRLLVSIAVGVSIAAVGTVCETAAGVPSPRLFPVPGVVTRTCKQTARQFKIRVLCPTVFPRASMDAGLLPPPKLMTFVYKGDGLFGGFSYAYGVPWAPDLSHASDSPAAFLHFELDRANSRYWGGSFRMQQDARHVRLGGRVGWLRPADGSGPLFGNHVRFYFMVGGVTWAATLHSFGDGTTTLLGRLVEHLRVIGP